MEIKLINLALSNLLEYLKKNPALSVYEVFNSEIMDTTYKTLSKINPYENESENLKPEIQSAFDKWYEIFRKNGFTSSAYYFGM